MRYLKTYKIFESDNNLDSIANQFITDMSKIYDLRLGQPFDKNKANCAWFSQEFYKWAKSKGLDVKVIYFDSDVEAHIAPILNGKVIDFAVKQFTKDPNDDYLILNTEDYQKYGYNKFEIYDELPQLETVFPADRKENVQISESKETESSKLKFKLQPKKKGSKTDTYNVIKDGNVIGQIKWYSRIRGYGFLPTNDCNDEIKEFIKELMRKRREDK